jgi:uncharacterized protein YggE
VEQPVGAGLRTLGSVRWRSKPPQQAINKARKQESKQASKQASNEIIELAIKRKKEKGRVLYKEKSNYGTIRIHDSYKFIP